MFDEKMDKGLFTFYWEENQKQQHNIQSSSRSQLCSPTLLDKPKVERSMEEKMASKKHHKTEKIQPQRYQRHQEFQYSHIDKQNKSILIPHHVTLSPKMDHTRRVKPKKSEIKIKHYSELQETKLFQNDREAQQQIPNPLEKLLFQQQPVEYHKKTIQIAESLALSKSNYLNTVRPMKIRKATIKQEHHLQRTDQLCFSSKKLPIIHPPQQSKNKCLPVLFGKYSHKKLKNLNENYLLQKLLAEKPLNEGNSVVNIGISSNDEYKLRWKKRKEQFLSLINKNMSKEDFNSQ